MNLESIFKAMDTIATRQFTCPRCQAKAVHYFLEKLHFTDVECSICRWLGFFNWEHQQLFDATTKKEVSGAYFTEIN